MWPALVENDSHAGLAIHKWRNHKGFYVDKFFMACVNAISVDSAYARMCACVCATLDLGFRAVSHAT